MENHYSKPPCTASQTSSELQLAMSRKAARLAESSHRFSEAELSEISTEGIVTNRCSVGHADLEDSESQSLVPTVTEMVSRARGIANARVCAARQCAHIHVYYNTKNSSCRERARVLKRFCTD